MNLLRRIWRSSLGKKYAMALTGLVLFLFVVGHLLGNLQVFGPPEMINRYSHFLKSQGELLWAARLGLLACVGIHIAAAIGLTLQNRAARPVGYVGGEIYGASRASRTMMISGSIIAAFVVYHLAHFTALLPGINGVGDFTRLTTSLHGETVPDVYAMMVLGFQVWWVTAFYLLAQALLFVHLGHGLASMFQSLGLRDRVWWPRIQCFARVVSIGLFAGYAIIPGAIFMRMVGADYVEKKKFELKAFARPAPPAHALVSFRPESGSQ